MTSYRICPYCGQIVEVGGWNHIYDSENYPPMIFRKVCRIENSRWMYEVDNDKIEFINRQRIRQILFEEKIGFLPVEPSWIEGSY